MWSHNIDQEDYQTRTTILKKPPYRWNTASIVTFLRYWKSRGPLNVVSSGPSDEMNFLKLALTLRTLALRLSNNQLDANYVDSLIGDLFLWQLCLIPKNWMITIKSGIIWNFKFMAFIASFLYVALLIFAK